LGNELVYEAAYGNFDKSELQETEIYGGRVWCAGIWIRKGTEF